MFRQIEHTWNLLEIWKFIFEDMVLGLARIQLCNYK